MSYLTDEELHDEMALWDSRQTHDDRFPNCKEDHWTDRCELCGTQPMQANCNNGACS